MEIRSLISKLVSVYIIIGFCFIVVLPIHAQDCTIPSTTPYCQDWDGIEDGEQPHGPTYNCWETVSQSDPDWTFEVSSTPSLATGPDAPFSGSAYIYLECSGGEEFDTDTLISALFDISSLSNPQFSFYYHMFGYNMGSLTWEINDGSGWSNLGSVTGQQQASTDALWIETTNDLSAYTSPVRIRFIGEKGSFFASDMALDNICIRETPVCSDPGAPLADNILANSIELSWNENGTASSWDIYYVQQLQPDPDANTTPSISAVNTNSNYLVDNLTAGEDYNLYVRAVCSGSSSDWIGPLTIHTPDAGESCEEAISISVGSNCGTATPITADWNNSVQIEYMTCDTYGYNNGFWYSFTATSPSIYLYPGNVGFKSAVLEGCNGTPIYCNEQLDASTRFIPNLTVGQIYRLVIWRENGSTLSTDFCLEEGPTCFSISNFIVDNIGENTADVSWDVNLQSTNFIIEYGLEGFAFGSGTQITSGNPGGPITLNNLNDNGSYDVYLIDECEGNNSIYGPLNFSTLCVPISSNYCLDFSDLANPEVGDFGNCWYSVNPLSAQWKLHLDPTSYDHDGPFKPYIGNKYIYLDNSSNSGILADTLYSPQFDLSGFSSAELNFHYYMFGYYMGAFEWELTNDAGATWNTLGTISGQQQTNSFSPWEGIIEDLSGYNSLVQFRFIGTPLNSGQSTNISIDYFCIRESNSCTSPSNPIESNTSSSSLELSWIENGTATSWDLFYGPSGITTPSDNTAPTENNISSNSNYFIGNLNYEIIDIYIRSECSGANSYWLGPYIVDLPGPGESCAEGITMPVLEEIDYVDLPLYSDQVFMDNASCVWLINHPHKGVWYKFVPTSASILIYGDGYTNMDVTVYEVCGGEEIVCYTTTNQIYDYELVYGLTPGETYFLKFQSRFTQHEAFSLVAGPNCLGPINLAVDNITSNSAEASWTVRGNPHAFTIEYGPAGFPLGTGTQITSGSIGGPVPIAGLDPGTFYTAYMWESCLSFTSDTLSKTFFTECAVEQGPYVEGFNDLSLGTFSILENCWSSSGAWRVWTGETPGLYSGPAGALEGNRYVYFENNESNITRYLYSPTIDLSTLSVPELSFYYNLRGIIVGNLYWDVSEDNGVTWTNLGVIYGNTQSTDDNWYEKISDLSSFTGPIIIRYTAESNGSGAPNDIALDLIKVREHSDCPVPTNIVALFPSETNAEIQWTEMGTATEWDLEIIPAETTPTGIPNFPNVTSIPFLWTGGSADQSYDVFIRSKCTGEDSYWSQRYRFSTACSPIVDLCETFEPNSPTEKCWLTANQNNDNNVWALNNNGAPFQGEQCASLFAGSNQQSDDWLISAPIQLNGIEELSFYHRTQRSSNSMQFEVLLSTSSNMLPDFTSTLIPLTSYNTTWYQEYIIDLQAYSGTVYIAWHASGTNTSYNRLYIDNVCIQESECAPSFDLTGTNNGNGSNSSNNALYESSGTISSSQTISAGANVNYDSATDIILEIGFETISSAVFGAFIDGCGNEGN